MKRICNVCTAKCVLDNDFMRDEPIRCPLYSGYTPKWVDPNAVPAKVYHNKIEVSKHQLLRIQQIIDEITMGGYTGICVGNATGSGVNREICGKACEDICWMMFKNADEEHGCPCHNGHVDVVKENFQELLDYNLSL